MMDATLLYVSDDPETFRGHGRLFHAPLPDDGRIMRLLFDHVNGTAAPMRVIAAISNIDTAAAVIAVLGSGTKPLTNFMAAGHAATANYLRALQANAVSRHPIVPGGSFVLSDFVLQPGECVAGIYDVDPGTGGPALEARVIACDPSHDQLAVFDALPEAADDGKSRRGVFDISASLGVVPIAVGTPVEIGKNGTTYTRDPLDPYGGVDHKGEYGVVKRFESDLAGPLDARLYQSARGGGATGSFVVDGVLMQSHRIDPTARFKIASFGIPSGSTKHVTLVTMPDINSNLPVELSIAPNDTTIAEAGTPGSPIFTA